MSIELTGRRISLDGIGLNVIDVGQGPAVLLLHGFPDRALLWRHQITTLAAAGYRVVAPDLRGFGDSDRPADVESYRYELVIGDVLGLLDVLGLDRVAVAGHDLGARVGWTLAGAAPERVSKLAALSVGHPLAIWGAGFAQRQLSWYMLWFQFRGVAESQMPVDDWRWFREWGFDGASRAADAEIDRQLTDLERPGALTAGLNWYRANVSPEVFGGNGGLTAPPPVQCPVLGVWSDRDMAMTERQMVDSARYVAGPWRYERIPGVGHWIPTHAAQRTSDLLLEFFA